MPLPMVHFAVAWALKDEPYARAFPQTFLLGANAPDSIHKRPGWTRADKDVSHLRDEQLTDPGRQARLTATRALLARKTGDPQTDAFTAGYCVHLFTDIIWLNLLYHPVYIARYRADPAPELTEKAAYYNDTNLADLALYRTLPWRPRLWDMLADTRPLGLEGLVSAQEVSLWRDHYLGFYDALDLSAYKPARYLTCEDIHTFIQEAIPLVQEQIARS
jgi:hypothetical protein